MKQRTQSLFKSGVLLWCAFFGAFEPATGCPVFPGRMAYKEQCINVVPGVFPAILMEDTALLRQTHGCQSIILGDDRISRLHPVYQGIVHAVGSLVKYKGLRPIPLKDMGGVA